MKIDISSVFRPKLFDIIINRRYDKKTFMSDLTAGVIVGIIALPLSIAFGIASGVTPQQGLITAIVAGLLTSLLGGSKFLIGGPTGAFIVIVYGIVTQYGISGLIIATVLAGVILVLMGLFKLGNIIKFIPYPIVVGFTSGIALVIFSTQIKDLLGLKMDSVPSDFIPKWLAYFNNISSINFWESALGLISLGIIVFWPKINKKIPGSLVAIVLGTIGAILLSKFTGIDFATIGSKFPELAGGVPLPRPETPKIDFEAIRLLFQPAITIAILCAIESLLAAMVADGVTGKRHDSYQNIKVRIIRMRKVPFIDSTGLNNLRNLWKRSRKEKIHIILSGVNDQVFDSLLKSGFINEIGREYVFPHITMALEKASEIVRREERSTKRCF